MRAARLGVVVNPIAGMGGRAGLHGTDGPALAAAVARGAEPVAVPRARRTLSRLRTRLRDHVEVLTASGPMGADLLDELDWPHRIVHPATVPSVTADTVSAVRAMRAQDVALVLFVGGDGTARDVADAVGPDGVVLGVPAGVKMHSATFATSPEAAAEVAARFLADPARIGTASADVVDLAGAGITLFGTVQVPAVDGQVQHAKSGAATRDDAALAALGREVAAEMEADRLYLLGPGTTVAHVSAALGVAPDVVGVDAVVDGALIGTDLTEAELRALLATHPNATLVLGVVGGQGFLLGRGNQQLSAAVVATVGAENVVVLAAAGKIAALDPPVLHVDLGDAAAETPLHGYRRVRTAPGRSTVLKIVA